MALICCYATQLNSICMSRHARRRWDCTGHAWHATLAALRILSDCCTSKKPFGLYATGPPGYKNLAYVFSDGQAKRFTILYRTSTAQQPSLERDNFDRTTHKGLSLLPAVRCQSKDLHTEVIQLVDDLLQTGQVVAADWAVLATVYNN